MPTTARSLQRTTPRFEEKKAVATPAPPGGTQTGLQQMGGVLGQAPEAFQGLMGQMAEAYGARGSRGAAAGRQGALMSGFTPLEAAQSSEDIWNEAMRSYYAMLPQMQMDYAQTMAPLWGQYAQLGAQIPGMEAQTELTQAQIPLLEQQQQTYWEERAREEAARQAYYNMVFPSRGGGGATGGAVAGGGGGGAAGGGGMSPGALRNQQRYQQLFGGGAAQQTTTTRAGAGVRDISPGAGARMPRGSFPGAQGGFLAPMGGQTPMAPREPLAGRYAGPAGMTPEQQAAGPQGTRETGPLAPDAIAQLIQQALQNLGASTVPGV